MSEFTKLHSLKAVNFVVYVNYTTIKLPKTGNQHQPPCSQAAVPLTLLPTQTTLYLSLTHFRHCGEAGFLPYKSEKAWEKEVFSDTGTKQLPHEVR